MARMAMERVQGLQDAPRRSTAQFPARSCYGAGLNCIYWHKGKKNKIKLGFPLFHFTVSFWARLWAFLRKPLNCPIKSSHHKAMHSSASERSLLFCYYQVLSISPAQFHLRSLFSEPNPSPANNLCLPPPQYSLSIELLETPVMCCLCLQ